MRAISDDNLIFSVLLLIVQILSFACGVVAVAIPAGLALSPPTAAVLPVVDEIVTSGGGGDDDGGARLVGVDVDELSVGTVTAVEGGPAAAADCVLQMLAMIMSLRVRGLPLEAAAGSEVLAGSEVALWISGSFLALNKRILAFSLGLRHH